jgi:hypothetical protein
VGCCNWTVLAEDVVSSLIKWSLRFRIAIAVHRIVNRLAWRFACPPGPKLGRALRIDRTHPLWRLNDWTASHWTGEYIRKMQRASREAR